MTVGETPPDLHGHTLPDDEVSSPTWTPASQRLVGRVHPGWMRAPALFT